MEAGKPNLPNLKSEPSRFSSKRFRSAELFAGGQEIVIEHGDFEYRLIQTKTGKLVLNK